MFKRCPNRGWFVNHPPPRRFNDPWLLVTRYRLYCRCPDHRSRLKILSKKSNDKVLAGKEQEKKRKYLAPCIANRRHFTPLVSSTDGLIGKEQGQTFTKRLAGLLSEKWRRPYSQVFGYGNGRLSIALVRATHCCLRGSHVPAPLISLKYAQWEDGAGLNLWRY